MKKQEELKPLILTLLKRPKLTVSFSFLYIFVCKHDTHWEIRACVWRKNIFVIACGPENPEHREVSSAHKSANERKGLVKLPVCRKAGILNVQIQSMVQIQFGKAWTMCTFIISSRKCVHLTLVLNERLSRYTLMCQLDYPSS